VPNIFKDSIIKLSFFVALDIGNQLNSKNPLTESAGAGWVSAPFFHADNNYS